MIVCADDFGLAEHIDAAILELAGRQRLSAVSCMVVFERCTPALLAGLLAYQHSVDIGLHLCLTKEDPALSGDSPSSGAIASMPSFGGLFRRALGNCLNISEIQAQIELQYRLFLEKCGRSPDFIDGHLHVHQLPGIRRALVRFVQGVTEPSRPYIRNTALPLSELRRKGLPWFKAALIGHFGKRMKEALLRLNLATNTGFAGIYDFRRWREYPRYFPGFVDCLPQPNGILVVHPGKRESWRQQEFATLERFVFPQGSPARFRFLDRVTEGG